MGAADDEFLRTLRETFRVEAAEHLQTLATGLLELEKRPGAEARRAQVASVFRAAHSLKGAARAVDFGPIEDLCQALEDRFASWKRDERPPLPADLDRAHRDLDAIAAALERESVRPAAPAAAPAPRGSSAPEERPPPERPAPSHGETVRISLDKLEKRLIEAEEMLTVKLAAGQRAEELRDLAVRFAALRREWPQAGGEQARALETHVVTLSRAAERDRHAVGKLVDELLEDSKKLLLLPFAGLAAPFPKLVRDLCRDQGKEADFAVRGEELEIDKRILEEMKDPLIHILRNCVDHGIEAPAERMRLGKPRRASLVLAAASVNGSKVEITVADDGAGIDAARVREAAVQRGLLSAEDAGRLGDPQARDLVFQADVSTRSVVSSISGRGLGLAIVREKAESLGGSVSVESEPGKGALFRITLPSTLATFRGVVVEAEGRVFIVPTAQVDRAMRAGPEAIRTVEGRDVVPVGGKTVPWVRLAGVLSLPASGSREGSHGSVPALLIGSGSQQVAFAVDAILGEQEVLVKHLAPPLFRVRHVAGATVLASGAVAPVLNVGDLLKSARGLQSAASPKAAPLAKSILVAEDSITSRTLIKGILETAGYRVQTAVDGLEAFSFLKSGTFDLVVSDVEMPRLGGFDLTARIRADRRISELPVILVTALEKREDRERGIDVGASAYIVKSKFDQSDLLDAVRRLA
jgi:two-component system chemotaxis sensor kinase CheA